MNAVKLPLLAASLLCATTVSVGCANDMDEGDAKDGWRATSLALASADAQIATEVDGEGNAVLTATCPGGGSVRYDGSYGSSQEFALEVSFDKCKAGGITTSGELSYAAKIDVSTGEGESSSRVELSYTGHLTWSGDVEGDCSLDATMVAESSVSNGNASASVEARGTMCGYSADAVIGVSY